MMILTNSSPLKDFISFVKMKRGTRISDDGFSTRKKTTGWVGTLTRPLLFFAWCLFLLLVCMAEVRLITHTQHNTRQVGLFFVCVEWGDRFLTTW
jgi:hypothetical protein